MSSDILIFQLRFQMFRCPDLSMAIKADVLAVSPMDSKQLTQQLSTDNETGNASEKQNGVCLSTNHFRVVKAGLLRPFF